MSMAINPKAVLACVSLSCLLVSCDTDDTQCGAAGINSITVDLHRAEWPDGEYTMRVRYDARAGDAREHECVFVLPDTGTGEDVCRDDEWPFASVSIGATVALRIDSAPRTLELELDGPDGEHRELMITPEYQSSEICGGTYYAGSELVSLDDD
jgi:hypothetical protein